MLYHVVHRSFIFLFHCTNVTRPLDLHTGAQHNHYAPNKTQEKPAFARHAADTTRIRETNVSLVHLVNTQQCQFASMSYLTTDEPGCLTF